MAVLVKCTVVTPSRGPVLAERGGLITVRATDRYRVTVSLLVVGRGLARAELLALSLCA